MFSFSSLLDLLGKLCIPLVIAFVSYLLAKRQLNSSNVNQFRQRWMEDFRSTVSLFIAKAETVSIIDLDDSESYMKHFQEFVQTQMKIELLLNYEDDDHSKFVKKLNELRGIIHKKTVNNKNMRECIQEILEAAKDQLYSEWMIIKKA